MSNQDSKQQKAQSLLEEIGKDVRYVEKEQALKRASIDQRYDELKRSEDEMKRLASLSVRETSNEYYEKMRDEERMMRESLKNRISFITPSLTEAIPFSYPNLILVGGKSGEGKSTTVANIALPLILEGKRVLVLSNEEMALNVFNRVICLHKGWNINRIQDFTDEQFESMAKIREAMGRAGRLRVIDPDFQEFKDATTTYEGLKFILDKELEHVRAGHTPFDAVIIDYFQKICTSRQNARLSEYEVLKKVTDYLDGFYKRYPAPITLMAQIKPEAKDESEFEFRIKGCKNIYVTATYALEVKPDKNKKRTDFICHKHRFGEQIGTATPVGWEKGRFIPYTPEFQAKVERDNADRAHRDLMKAVGRKVGE